MPYHHGMLNTFKKLWNTVFYEGYQPSEKPSLTNDAFDGETPQYPPITQGIPVSPTSNVLESQSALIAKIQQTSGITKDDWAKYMLPLFDNLVRYVHLLPASAVGEYKGAGGLLRMALEIGFYSLQAANSSLFLSKGSSSAEVRYKMHPRWCYATFAAGICSVLYRIPTQMVVTDENGVAWPLHLEFLYDWLKNRKAERYFVVWNDGSFEDSKLQQTASAYFMNTVIPKEGLHYISEDNNEIMTAMTAAATGSTPMGVKNQIEQIIKSVTSQLIQRDLKRSAQNYGEFTVGSHIEPVLLDGMRKLIKKGAWGVNTKGARIWNSREGLFIVWGLATKELVALLNSNNLSWIPTEPDTLADILISAQIAESNSNDGRYWEIYVPPGMQALNAIKIVRIEALFNEPGSLEVLEGYLLPQNLQGATQAPAKPAKTQTAQGEEIATPKPAKQEKPASAKLPVVTPKASRKKAEDGPADGTKASVPKDETEPQQEQLALPEQAAETDRPSENSIDSLPPPPDIPIGGQKHEIAEHSLAMLKTLTTENASFLQAIIEDHLNGTSEGLVFATPNGIFISVEELGAHGHDNFAGLLSALETKSWLWVDPDKPLRKVFNVEHAGKSVKGTIIKGDTAKMLGFNWKPQKNRK